MSKSLLYCSNCGNTVQCEEIAKSKRLIEMGDFWENYEHTAIFQCSTCGSYIIKITDDGFLDAMLNNDIHVTYDDWFQLYPHEQRLDKSIPEEIRDAITKVRRETNRSLKLFLIENRVILENILKIEGYTKGSLKTRIEKFVKEKKCPKIISIAAHYVREKANEKAHENKRFSDDGLKEEIENVNYCMDKIIDYLYVAKAMKKKLGKKG